jgi:hypothetical protein
MSKKQQKKPTKPAKPVVGEVIPKGSQVSPEMGKPSQPLAAPVAEEQKNLALAAERPLDISTREFKKQLQLREENRKILIDWIKKNLKAGIDYMRVWSKKQQKWSKPFLLKPGSEKICGMLGVMPTFPNLKEYEQRLRDQLHVNSIVILCHLVNAQGRVVAEGVGARLLNDDDNNDLNKALKMALKSSQTDATLRYGGLSEIFTQEPDSEPPEISTIITDVQYQELLDLVKKSPLREEKIAEYFAVTKLQLLPAEFFARCKRAIVKKINEAEAKKKETETPEDRS